jgi:hypothetical protein
MRKIVSSLTATAIFALAAISCSHKPSEPQNRAITPGELRDKIAGGWAGKIIGVTYGGPTEFRAQGKMYEDSIHWKPSDAAGSLGQDDIYVQLTFMMAMDQYGIDAPAKKFQEMMAKAGYTLWHANMQARKNYFDSIFPPASGAPEHNLHADDIDFQIEADYLGFMCPAMPNTAAEMANKIGHIMNFGEGLYGGIFVAALYSEAFFETDVDNVVNKALLSVPSESDYAKIVSDVILLHKQYPTNWRDAWQELQNKWATVDICGAGSPFNIDAKLNGAYIVMGLLYGDGDPLKTLEISTRCGQDSDCNPSNALAVLGIMKGLSNLPVDMQEGVKAIADSQFIFTNYSFNKAVENTFNYSLQLIAKNGGTITDSLISIVAQIPQPAAFEDAFPNLVLDTTYVALESGAWQFKGDWKTFKRIPWGGTQAVDDTKMTCQANAEASLSFEGTGIALVGNWYKNGGKADVYIDSKLVKTIDTYYFYADQQHDWVQMFHILNLTPGKHTLRVVVTGTKRPESEGTAIYLRSAQVFKTEPKTSENHKFSFQQ